MESLRIGMFAWESLHAMKVGGLAPHVTELSEALAARGHEVHVFTRAGSLGPYQTVNGVRYQRVKHDQSGDIVRQMDCMGAAMADRLKAVERLFGRFDVLHGHDWHPAAALARMKKREGRDFVFTYHSTEWGRNGNRHSTSPEAREIARREWLAGHEAKAIVVTSPALKDEVWSLYDVPAAKMDLIPNGISPGKVRREVDPGTIKRRYGIHPLAPLVLFVGRMRYQKGPDLLVEAIPHALRARWDLKFAFVGDGDMREGCERRARELGVSLSHLS
jgi:glycosyltransferase involved in cell wall biosynthesis